MQASEPVPVSPAPRFDSSSKRGVEASGDPSPRLWVLCEQYGVDSQVWIRRQVARFTGFRREVVCCRGEEGVESVDGVPLHVVPATLEGTQDRGRWVHRLLAWPSGNFYRPRVGDAARVDAVFKRHRPDVILAHFGAMALWILPHAKKHGVPVVAHFHGLDLSSSLRNKWYRRSLLRSLRDFDQIVVVGSHQRRWMLEHGASEHRLHLIPCGVPSAWFTPAPESDRPCGETVLIANARLVPWKGVDVTLRAFASLKRRHPRLRLRIIGDGPERERLVALAAELGVGEAVSFLGSVSPEEVRKQLRSADLFVQHSLVGGNGWVEGFGVSISEASACELAVVATRTGGIPDQVLHGETGLLVEPGSVEQTADAVGRLLDDPSLRQGMGRAGRQRMVEHYDSDDMAERLSNVLQAAVNPRGG